MSHPIRYMLAAMAAGILWVSAADACGDKLVALGGGVSFDRVFSSRHPGKLIMYLNPASPFRAENDQLRIDNALERAGHSVRRVATRAELERALQEAAADLVVMDWADARALHAEMRGRAPILSVLSASSEDANASADLRSGCFAEANKRKGRQVVRAVEQILERQGQGARACIS